MCGIAGFSQPSAVFSADHTEQIVKRMADRLTARGPDDAGTWVDPSSGTAFGHRRLAVIDLSPAGHQPMFSASGRFAIVYNGEIYNHRDLRGELIRSGVQFRGESDTEVIIEAIAAWGLSTTLERLIGMFAFALWDHAEQQMTLVRDRLGIKPLYWEYSNQSLKFASEIKALREYPDWSPGIDRNAIASFMRHNYVPAPLSGLEGVRKLEPGCTLTFRPGGEPRVERFWDFRAVAHNGIQNRTSLDRQAVVDSLETLLKDAVGRRMIADVPLGALLSGGVDSSLVAALMQAESRSKVRTFSIGFSEQKYNEAPYAKAVADHIGTEHTELYVQPRDALDTIPDLAKIYDEPFADSSQIPTYLVCRLTRQHVTVVLSGDGGDEVFGGYTRYQLGQKIWNRTRKIPLGVRHLISRGLLAVPEHFLDSCAKLLPEERRPNQFGLKVHKTARGLPSSHPDALYRQLLSHWSDPEDVVIGATEPRGEVWNDSYRQLIPDFTERMQFLDTLTYLPDDILTKVDRASMATSLEARVPLLDHRIVEFAWTLPEQFKLHRGQGKSVLREILDHYVPRELIERPKMGFGIPIDQWLRGPLRDWAESLLDPQALSQQGLLNVPPVREMWMAHQNGENWAYQLWNVLMLQAWIAEYEVSV